MIDVESVIEQYEMRFVETDGAAELYMSKDDVKSAMREFAKQLLEMAAENAKTEQIPYWDGTDKQKIRDVEVWEDGQNVPSYLAVTEKSSVTGVIRMVKF